MTPHSKNGCSIPPPPPDRSVYLKFRCNVSKEHKKEVRNFGDYR